MREWYPPKGTNTNVLESSTLKFQLKDQNRSIKGATVNIADKSSKTGKNGGCTVKDIPIGEQTVTVEKKGYEPYIDTINVDESNPTIKIDLNKIHG